MIRVFRDGYGQRGAYDEKTHRVDVGERVFFIVRLKDNVTLGYYPFDTFFIERS